MGKLRKPTTIVQPVCLAVQTPGTGSAGANLQIAIEGCDPRLVVVPSLWVERATDSAGPAGTNAAVASGVTWTAYSARRNAKGDLKTFCPLPGFEDRAIRGANAWGADGILRAGDSFELSSTLPIVLGIRIADITGQLSSTCQQSLWFALEVCPSDALEEARAGQEDGETYAGLLRELAVSKPSDVARIKT